jgi:hypothetical protein
VRARRHSVNIGYNFCNPHSGFRGWLYRRVPGRLCWFRNTPALNDRGSYAFFYNLGLSFAFLMTPQALDRL